jgi:hypothetical protein
MIEKAKLVKRILGLENQQTLWMLTQKGALEVGAQITKRYWSKNMLEHDFQLNELRLALEKAEIVHSWIPEHEIRSAIFKKHGPLAHTEKIVPDGLIGIDVNGKKESLALELELTLKNQDRIQKTMKKYISTKPLYGLWYVAPKMSVLTSVWNHWQKCGGTKSGIKFHVSLLSEVLASPLNAKLMGQRPIMTIGESWNLRVLTPSAQGLSKQRVVDNDQYRIPSESNHTPYLERVS